MRQKALISTKAKKLYSCWNDNSLQCILTTMISFVTWPPFLYYHYYKGGQVSLRWPSQCILILYNLFCSQDNYFTKWSSRGVSHNIFIKLSGNSCATFETNSWSYFHKYLQKNLWKYCPVNNSVDGTLIFRVNVDM